jgi:hypothetical protein
MKYTYSPLWAVAGTIVGDCVQLPGVKVAHAGSGSRCSPIEAAEISAAAGKDGDVRGT